MARVDFYIIGDTGARHRQTFACRLAEKAYRLDHTVHIHTPGRADADRIDELLWTFRDGSFVPHHCLGTAGTGLDSPVTIGFEPRVIEPRDLLINLGDDVPAFAESFPRVAELVTSDPDSRQLGRKRFAKYRDQGHTIETHDV